VLIFVTCAQTVLELNFNEQLMSLVQANPLSHKLTLTEYKNDKINDDISQTSQIL